MTTTKIPVEFLNAITGTEITDGSIATADIADSAITTAKIAANAITATQLPDNVNCNPYTKWFNNWYSHGRNNTYCYTNSK